MLGFLDSEITEAFQYRMRRSGMTLRLGEKVEKIEQLPPNNGHGGLVQATLESGKHLQAADAALCRWPTGDNHGFASGCRWIESRRPRTAEGEQLLSNGSSAHLRCRRCHRVPGVASTAMEQGRQAVCHAFGAPTNSMPELFPLGIYALPEISMVGRTEKQLTDAGIPYEAGIAQYKEIARGQLLGDDIGMLKLLIHQENHQILGVHAIGSGATELIHIGQAVMAFNGTVDFFINNVFNFPTLAEAYKVAALNGLNKLRHI